MFYDSKVWRLLTLRFNVNVYRKILDKNPTEVPDTIIIVVKRKVNEKTYFFSLFRSSNWTSSWLVKY